MGIGLAAELAALLAPGPAVDLETSLPWSDILALLSSRLGAELAVALAFDTGRPARRLGSFGPLPASLAQAVDAQSLVPTLARLGMGTIWARLFPRGEGSAIVVVVARRQEGDFGPLTEDIAPLLDLGIGAATAATQLMTERKHRHQLEARLVEIERQSTVGAVASAVAHDLAAPISALLMEVSELRERIDYLGGVLGESGPIVHNVLDDLRGLAAHCTDSTERARQLLIDFRLAAHPASSGPRGPSAVAVSIADILRSCVRLIAPLARDKVRMHLIVEQDLPIITGARRRLEQAITNLLVNAIHAASVREGFAGRVDVEAKRFGNELVIEIRDNGPGIAPDVQAQMFEPFFTTKPPHEGTGLGLPIAKDSVEAHGGTLEVQSERGRGATFRIRLPIDAVPAHAAPAVSRRRVLVVDDDDGVGRALERILRTDYEVTIAQGGEPALQLLGSGAQFDALIVDLAMPGIDGPELYERIRLRWPGLESKIVFATGGAFTAATRAFLARVPNSRFEKPISREELRPIVLRVVTAA